MSQQVLHKRSNETVNGMAKVPAASGLSYGEIAINYNAGTEKIFIKNSDNEVVSFGTDKNSPFEAGTGVNSAQLKGSGAIASGENSVAEGADNIEGQTTPDAGDELLYAKAEGYASHAEGAAHAIGKYSHAEGGGDSIQEGYKTVPTAEGSYSHAEGTHTYAKGSRSHAEGLLTQALGDGSHVEGYKTIGRNANDHAEGLETVAEGWGSHAEGELSVASAARSHAEGYNTKTGGNDTANTRTAGTVAGAYSHAEGNASIANGQAAHAEGTNTLASNHSSHAEGSKTIASAPQSHAEGINTQATANRAHAEGNGSVASGENSHAEGSSTTASSNGAHSEGNNTMASGLQAHAEGLSTIASGARSHAEGNGSKATGSFSHAENRTTIAQGHSSHAEGMQTVAGTDAKQASNADTTAGYFTHAEGNGTIAYGNSSHAEGKDTQANGLASHVEGNNTTASGDSAHAEGNNTTASGDSAHAEGKNTKANRDASHAEGINTKAIERFSHAEGGSTTAFGECSHAEGNGTTANGYSAHAEGHITTAQNTAEHAEGQYNVSNRATTTYGNSGNTQHSVGIGTGSRKNAFEIMQNGDAYLYGVGGYDGTNASASTSSTLQQTISGKQDTLISGTNIKAINNESILGSGNLVIRPCPDAITQTSVGSISIGEGGSDANGDRSLAVGEAYVAGDDSFGVGSSERVRVEDGTASIAYGRADMYDDEGTLTQDTKISAGGAGGGLAGGYAYSDGEITVKHGTIDPYGHDTSNRGLGSVSIGMSAFNSEIEASGSGARAQGYAYGNAEIKATGDGSIAEGYTWDESTIVATGKGAHAEGCASSDNANIQATNRGAHAEGSADEFGTILASGEGAHAEGIADIGGNITASGKGSHAEGYGTIAQNDYEHAQGTFNKSNVTSAGTAAQQAAGSTRFSVGIGGKDVGTGINAIEIMVNGDTYIKGIGNYDGTNATANTSSTLQQVLSNVGCLTEITWSNLKSLRDSSGLTPGMQYRITDYNTTTVQSNTQAAGHQFDIIVVADDNHTLNENARAIRHSGDTYFSGATLEAWELKYDIDNDTTKYAWADSGATGRGVIYYMKDEWGNECPYDFKNIQFKRKISLSNGYPELDLTGGADTWVFTFAATSHHITNDTWSGLKDGSLEPPYGHESDENNSTYHDNVMGKYIKLYDGVDEDYTKCGIQYLNDNVFLGYWEEIGSDGPENIPYYYAYCSYGCTFGVNCYSNTFGNGCYSSTFGNYCYRNTFGNDCYSNTFGNYCYSNTFGNNCDSNTFGNYCYSSTFGNYCYRNTFGNECYSNTFGNECYSNTFGNDCYNNTFGNDCYNNTFGNNCYSNTFGNYCYSSTFGNYCYRNTFGNNCDSNTFGESVQYFITGNATGATTSAQTKDYIQYLIVENGVQYVNAYCTGTTSSSNYCQNIKIGLGVKGTSSSNRLQIDITSQIGATASVTYQPANSQIISI